MARPAKDGRFSLAGMPGGIYRAIARDAVEDGQWEDASFLAQLRDEGIRFVLADGATETRTIKRSASK